MRSDAHFRWITELQSEEVTLSSLNFKQVNWPRERIFTHKPPDFKVSSLQQVTSEPMSHGVLSTNTRMHAHTGSPVYFHLRNVWHFGIHSHIQTDGPSRRPEPRCLLLSARLSHPFPSLSLPLPAPDRTGPPRSALPSLYWYPPRP